MFKTIKKMTVALMLSAVLGCGTLGVPTFDGPYGKATGSVEMYNIVYEQAVNYCETSQASYSACVKIDEVADGVALARLVADNQLKRGVYDDDAMHTLVTVLNDAQVLLKLYMSQQEGEAI